MKVARRIERQAVFGWMLRLVRVRCMFQRGLYSFASPYFRPLHFSPGLYCISFSHFSTYLLRQTRRERDRDMKKKTEKKEKEEKDFSLTPHRSPPIRPKRPRQRNPQTHHGTYPHKPIRTHPSLSQHIHHHAKRDNMRRHDKHQHQIRRHFPEPPARFSQPYGEDIRVRVDGIEVLDFELVDYRAGVPG